jgi:hypothetical protein
VKEGTHFIFSTTKDAQLMVEGGLLSCAVRLRSGVCVLILSTLCDAVASAAQALL